MTQAIIEHLITAVGGCAMTAIAWIVKSMYRAKRDIDFAHHKIRILEEKLKGKD